MVGALQAWREAGGRDGGGRGRFRATTVKLMLDGVCETFTAAMSAPYLGRHGEKGRLFIDPEIDPTSGDVFGKILRLSPLT